MSQTFGPPPWHMWGTSETLNLHADATVAAPPVQSKQMCRVGYGRPDTWRFFVAAEIENAVVAAGGGGINVSWALTIGVGRSQKTIPNWIVMVFPLVGAGSDLRRTWTTAATMPPLDPGVPDVSPRLSELLPASDIQLNVNFTLFAASSIDVVLRLDAYFAPNVHTRPDWYKDDPNARFTGGEDGGK